MPADDRFIVRAVGDGDERDILDLFARSFQAPRTHDHFAWKYLQNPFGNRHISLTFDGGALAGHYAGYPVPFWYEGRELIAHQIGDTMTDRAVRHVGRGPSSVLGRTAGHFYQTFCDGKVAFNYGFNVSNIQRFSLRFLRSDRVEPVHYRVVDGLRPMARVRRWASGYRLGVVAEVGPDFDELFTRAAPAYRFLVHRSAEYVRWRYLQLAEGGYFVVAVRKGRTLAGWSAFRIRHDRLQWIDALFDPAHADAAEVLLRHIAHAYPVRRVEAWFPPRPAWFDAVLARLGFITAPEPQDLSLMCVPFTFAGATDAMREALYYTMGDSDLF